MGTEIEKIFLNGMIFALLSYSVSYCLRTRLGRLFALPWTLEDDSREKSALRKNFRYRWRRNLLNEFKFLSLTFQVVSYPTFKH